MGVTVKKPDRSDFIPAPAGLHRSVCVDVVDMGLVDTGKFGVQDVVRLVWQTEATGADGKRYTIHKRYNKTLGAKANLRRYLVSWRGLDFNPEELKGFDLDKLLGVNCQLNVVHNQKEIDGDLVTFANVNSIVPAPQGSDRLQPLDYEREQDRTQETQSTLPQQTPGPHFETPSPDAEDQPDFDIPF
jgi:hypothetical protein